MADIQNPDPVQKLLRQYRIRSPFGIHLAEELVPVVVVDDISGSSVADRGYPRDAVGTAEVAAAVGFNGIVAWIPTNLVLAHLTTIIVSFDVDQGFTVRLLDQDDVITGLTNVTTRKFFDTRLTTLPGVTVGRRNTTTGTEGTQIMNLNVLADDPIFIDVSGVASGGGGIIVRCSTSNVLMRVTYLWTEYLLQDT